MHQGVGILSGTPETIIHDEQARSVYLGDTFSL
jgi:ABC-type lipopolysaccharide export system ATPase subunit